LLFKPPEIGNDRGVRDASGAMMKTRMTRLVSFYVFWLVLSGWSPVNAIVGIPAAALAAWACVILLPPTGRRLSFLRVLRFTAVFLWQSVAGGVDVAWRVFQPRMPLRPGIVRVSPRLPAGPGRLLFRGLASLQPGSLACGEDEAGYLLFHCLDTREDVEGALCRAQDQLAELWKEDQA
jgi:multicomponent Na+:H+ antiporter subunit E